MRIWKNRTRFPRRREDCIRIIMGLTHYQRSCFNGKRLDELQGWACNELDKFEARENSRDSIIEGLNQG